MYIHMTVYITEYTHWYVYHISKLIYIHTFVSIPISGDVGVSIGILKHEDHYKHMFEHKYVCMYVYMYVWKYLFLFTCHADITAYLNVTRILLLGAVIGSNIMTILKSAQHYILLMENNEQYEKK